MEEYVVMGGGGNYLSIHKYKWRMVEVEVFHTSDRFVNLHNSQDSENHS